MIRPVISNSIRNGNSWKRIVVVRQHSAASSSRHKGAGHDVAVENRFPTAAHEPRPKSGLQREILRLYKDALKVVLKKDASVRGEFYQWTRYQFQCKYPDLKRHDFHAIEHLLRLGRKQLSVMASDSVKTVQSPADAAHLKPPKWICK